MISVWVARYFLAALFTGAVFGYLDKSPKIDDDGIARVDSAVVRALVGSIIGLVGALLLAIAIGLISILVICSIEKGIK